METGLLSDGQIHAVAIFGYGGFVGSDYRGNGIWFWVNVGHLFVFWWVRWIVACNDRTMDGASPGLLYQRRRCGKAPSCILRSLFAERNARGAERVFKIGFHNYCNQ